MKYIDTNNPPEGYRELGKIEYSQKKGQQFYLFSDNKTLIILRKRPAKPFVLDGRVIETDEPGFNLGQFEMPLAALPWMIDTIENKFWKKTSEGGLFKEVLHVDEIIDDEDLRIRFSPNCGGEGIQGFTFENYSRKEERQSWLEIQMPYSLLREDGMLELMKTIVK